MKPRSVSSHCPQSSMMIASLGPLGGALAVLTGAFVGNDDIGGRNVTGGGALWRTSDGGRCVRAPVGGVDRCAGLSSEQPTTAPAARITIATRIALPRVLRLRRATARASRAGARPHAYDLASSCGYFARRATTLGASL